MLDDAALDDVEPPHDDAVVAVAARPSCDSVVRTVRSFACADVAFLAGAAGSASASAGVRSGRARVASLSDAREVVSPTSRVETVTEGASATGAFRTGIVGDEAAGAGGAAGFGSRVLAAAGRLGPSDGFGAGVRSLSTSADARGATSRSGTVLGASLDGTSGVTFATRTPPVSPRWGCDGALDGSAFEGADMATRGEAAGRSA